MKLTELEPQFIRFEIRDETVGLSESGTPIINSEPNGYGFGSATIPVNYEIWCEFTDAQGVLLLCPKCFSDNKGPVGTHSVVVPFSGRGLTDDLNPIRNNEGKPVYWGVSGTGYDDLTTTPSILLLSGCQWHGFIVSGEIRGGI